MDVEVPENVVVGKLDALASWCRKNSLWPMPFATACCGIELMATGASRHDVGYDRCSFRRCNRDPVGRGFREGEEQQPCVHEWILNTLVVPQR